MLYQAYQFQDDILAPLREAAKGAVGMPVLPTGFSVTRRFETGLEMISRFELTHVRPEFAIGPVMVGNRLVPVREEVALDLPFGKLLHFAKDVDTPQPKVLVVAPLSGHFSTLLGKSCETLLRDHDVYIIDWVNARDVPVETGSFGVEDYVDYVIRFLERIGPGTHLLAVCQPCVQALAAVAIMSEDRHPDTPRSMTLMAGPIDPRESPTAVNKLATEKPLSWFKTSVPARYRGSGRRVYPGFLQLTAFIAMNMERHRAAHQKLYAHLAAGETEQAQKIKSFYDEYFAVLDLTEEFYFETIDWVFQKAELATGDFTFRGRKVDPGKICKTACSPSRAAATIFARWGKRLLRTSCVTRRARI